MTENNPNPQGRPRRLLHTVPAIIVGSVMFHFISYWRVAAVVLCDMSSTVYYIGAIVESAIGKAAPWFILAVLLFSYGMRAVYIESCGLFVRGGVYRVVRQAMGGLLAKVSVSALLFDYVLTGPISGVSAGQYIVALGLEAAARYADIHLDEGTRAAIKSIGSVAIACLITLYFLRQNLLGIPESSDKALKIMIATTVMGVIMFIWCGVTLSVKGAVNDIPTWQPDLNKKVVMDPSGAEIPKMNPITGHQEDPLGWLGGVPSLEKPLREPTSWFSLIGLAGIVIAFGHSILAMSGEETLAQVYREVESPKLPNFKKAAFIVFSFSFLLTGGMNLLAMLLIPDDQRMGEYYDNWMGGLAMQMVGPVSARLLLNALVTFVGFLILAGAVNTSIIGSNGVLSRVAEDGVLTDWFLKPHDRYGTTSRILYLIAGLQIVTIIGSRGDMILLGEAYAFGVVWSFVFMTLSMLVLRFKDRRSREFKVPLNLRFGKIEVPLGLGFVFLVVFVSAVSNFASKQVATVCGLIFSSVFLCVFTVTEWHHRRKRGVAKHEHVEQFTEENVEHVSSELLELDKPFRKLVAIRSPQNLYMLQKSLDETDPDTTEVVVMTAKTIAPENLAPTAQDLDQYDRKLMTAVIELAEKAGKEIKPLIVPTNAPLAAVVNTAKSLNVQELVVGASNKFTAEEQLDQLAFYWINLHEGHAAPLTIRVLSKNWDFHSDIGGGCRIPRISEVRARTVSELRAAGVGVDRALLVHDGTSRSSDVFESVLTMLDPDVVLALAHLPARGEDDETALATGTSLAFDRDRAGQLGREIEVHEIHGDPGAEILRLVQEHKYDVLILNPIGDAEQTVSHGPTQPNWRAFIREHATCPVCEVTLPAIPREVDKS